MVGSIQYEMRPPGVPWRREERDAVRVAPLGDGEDAAVVGADSVLYVLECRRSGCAGIHRACLRLPLRGVRVWLMVAAQLRSRPRNRR